MELTFTDRCGKILEFSSAIVIKQKLHDDPILFPAYTQALCSFWHVRLHLQKGTHVRG